MADLQVVAVLVSKPGSEEIVRGALNDLVAPTRAEDGCLGYDLFESAAEPGTFITIERWKAQADLDAHMGTPHIAQALTVAADHLGAAPAIHPLIPVDLP